jgi:hypothetical protein
MLVGDVGEDRVEDTLPVLVVENVRSVDDRFAMLLACNEAEDSVKQFLCGGEGDDDVECACNFDARALKSPLVVTTVVVLFDGSSEFCEEVGLAGTVLVVVRVVLHTGGINSGGVKVVQCCWLNDDGNCVRVAESPYIYVRL